jgi:hypothetical protein
MEISSTNFRKNLEHTVPLQPSNKLSYMHSPVVHSNRKSLYSILS